MKSERQIQSHEFLPALASAPMRLCALTLRSAQVGIERLQRIPAMFKDEAL